jgi:hypothetical protein
MKTINPSAHTSALRRLIKRGLPIEGSALPIPPEEVLADYIDQGGVGPGPVKLGQFRAALLLRGTPPLRAQDMKGDSAIAYVKLFDPAGAATFYLLEWDRQSNEAFCWGYTLGPDAAEYSYLDLAEIAAVRGPLGIGIEIDTWFHPTPLCEIKQKLTL